jgi:hypothetical protein
MSHILDERFFRQTSEAEGVVDPYTDLLDCVVDSCPGANLVLESQQWSRLAAIQQGGCTIYEPSELAGDELPFAPDNVSVQIAYFLNRDNVWDLAWVAVWPIEDD